MADPFWDLHGRYVSWLTRFVICTDVTCHGRPVLRSARTLRVMADPFCDLPGGYVSLTALREREGDDDFRSGGVELVA